MYELFVTLHVPVAIVFVGMMFWHCHNYLTSWNYLFATVGIWLSSYFMRLFYLNWTNPFRMSWLIGDEAAVTIMPENAIKVTIPTQVKWRPGQYVYLRMPGISVFENHPFTIASLCSDDFPSEYGEGYRDMVLVFRPFGGFTNKVYRSAIEHGPWHTYRAFVDGPYGGMQRRIEAFDDVVLIAGGSGITAIVSQLLSLIKSMRDGKAVTRSVHVIWALKRPETMEWFKEELRICREYAPPDSVTCQFYITTAKRMPTGQVVSAKTPTRPVSLYFHDKVNDAFQNIADHRVSGVSSKRHSALIRDEAQGDPEREKELRRENEDSITALPQAHLVNVNRGHLSPPSLHSNPSNHSLNSVHSLHSNQDVIAPAPRSIAARRGDRNLSLDISQALEAGTGAINPEVVHETPVSPASPTTAANTAANAAANGIKGFDFGFPSTPTEFQKNLMRFAFLPAAVKKKDGWSTEYGRPDLPYTLRELGKNFGRRACVFVCGPPSMRVAVADTVAELQKDVWRDAHRDEVFLHTENYAI
jgi:predicted ferric reductase